MYSVLPPSSPEDPFDGHGRFHFLVHGVAIGLAVSAAVPGLPHWLSSVLGAQIIAWSALGFAVSLVALKLVFGGGWKTASGMLFILAGGLYLGALSQNSPFQGAGLGAFIAAALVLGGLAAIYHESRAAAAGGQANADAKSAMHISGRKAPLAS